MAEQTIRLDNNFLVLYEDGLDGGGYDHLPDFKNAVSLSGKTHYTNAVEWCAGFGVIGFDFLNRQVCENMAFIDCYKLAIDWLEKTIEYNNIQNSTTLYHIDKISLLPNNLKYDLVLANPPHSFEQETKEMFERTIKNPSSRADVIRITCDVNLEIHKEFFDNIRKHLAPDADVFISEVGHLDTVQQLAEDAGLIFITKHQAINLSKDSKTDAVIFHFKEPS